MPTKEMKIAAKLAKDGAVQIAKLIKDNAANTELNKEQKIQKGFKVSAQAKKIETLIDKNMKAGLLKALNAPSFLKKHSLKGVRISNHGYFGGFFYLRFYKADGEPAELLKRILPTIKSELAPLGSITKTEMHDMIVVRFKPKSVASWRVLMTGFRMGYPTSKFPKLRW